MSGLGFNPEHIASARGVYDTYVGLVDGHIAAHNQPDQIMGMPTARYSVLEFPEAATFDGPYSSFLGNTAVIAFQTDMSSTRGRVHKFELLDPFTQPGGNTLFMLTVEEQDDRRQPGLPEAMTQIPGEEGMTLGRPFYDSDLIEDLARIARAVQELSQSNRLTPITMGDIQSMYRAYHELGES